MDMELSLGHSAQDSELESRVSDFLKEQRVPGAYRITPIVRHGVVTLRGRVSSFYHRQLCAHACCRVNGVRRVIDEIIVETTATCRPAFLSA